MSYLVQTSSPSCPTLVDLLRYRAAIDPDRLAYTFLTEDGQQDTLTYAALDERARAVSTHLRQRGAPGDRVLLLYQSGLEYIVALFGCAYAGRVAVPVYPPRPNRPAPALQAIVRDAQPYAALASARVASTLKTRLEHASATEIVCDSIDTVPLSLAAEWTGAACTPESIALLQYTSGSTSAPKAVIITHGNVMQNLAVIQRNFVIGREDMGVFWLPPYHDMGLIGAILEPMFAGMPSYLMAAASFLQRPVRWLQAISTFGGTISGAPNFAYEFAVQRVPAEQREELDLSPWRLAFCGGEPIRHETLIRFADTFAASGFRRQALYPCYGLAESTLMASGDISPVPLVTAAVNRAALSENRIVPSSGGAASTQLLVGCGRAAPRHAIAIVNPHTRVGCQGDEVGEIWVSGPSVAKGYWNRPDETAATFAAYRADTGEGPFARTGDLGFLRGPDLFVTGRVKDLIIIRGRNHYPADLELTVASAHDALLPAAGAAFSIDVDDEERLVVVHEIDRRCTATGDVIAAIRSALADVHDLQPYAIVLGKFGSVPKTSSGKIRRLACRAAYLNGEIDMVHEYRVAPAVAAAAAENGDEPAPRSVPLDAFKDLPEVLQACAGREVTRQQDELLAYFRDAASRVPALQGAALARLQQTLTELGLDSLTMVEFAHALGHALGRPLPPTFLFDYPTLDALTRYLLEAPPHAGPAAAAETARHDARQAAIRRIASSSDDEIEALLLAKLKRHGEGMSSPSAE